MSNCVNGFSLKRDPELTRIYQGVKFLGAKRNYSLHEGRSQVSSPKNHNHRREGFQESKKSPQFIINKEKKCLFRSNKKSSNQRYQNHHQTKIKMQYKLQVPKSNRNDTESTKDMIGVPSTNLQRQSGKMKKLVKFSQLNRFSMTFDIQSTPGPFQYHVEPEKNLTFYGKFDREKRMSLKLQQIPGVGQYSLEVYQEKHSPHAKFPAQRGRQKLFKSPEGPGPANYTSCLVEKYKMHSRSISISFSKQKRPFQIDQKLSPGPGDYEVTQKKNTSPTSMKGTFYSKQSQKFHQTHTMSLYKPNLDQMVQKSRTTRKRKQEKSPKNSQINQLKERNSTNLRGIEFQHKKMQFY